MKSLHDELIYHSAKKLQKDGWKNIKFEKRIGGKADRRVGCRADVSATKGERRIVVECETQPLPDKIQSRCERYKGEVDILVFCFALDSDAEKVKEEVDFDKYGEGLIFWSAEDIPLDNLRKFRGIVVVKDPRFNDPSIKEI